MNISSRDSQVLNHLLKDGPLQSSDIHAALRSDGQDISLVSVKRHLTELREKDLAEVQGAGRSTAYAISDLGRLFLPVSATDYNADEPDERYGSSTFNFSLFLNLPETVFTESELNRLDEATLKYRDRLDKLSDTTRKKELERLIIELSWKSSKIEGNTYTLLDTEKLLKEDIAAPDKPKDDTQMILNHKTAFTYIYNNADKFRDLSKRNIQEVHELLTQELEVEKGWRESLVGITGSKYIPLDNKHQINDAMEHLIDAINRGRDPYTRALLTLLGISYIQPFEDGNKRTSRLTANAVLLAHNRAPLSYRSVSEETYRSAMMVFYEINSLVPFKEVFIEQYLFATQTYAV